MAALIPYFGLNIMMNRADGTRLLYKRQVTPTPAEPEPAKTDLGLIVGVAVTTAIVIFGAVCVYLIYFWRPRYNSRRMKQSRKSIVAEETTVSNDISMISQRSMTKGNTTLQVTEALAIPGFLEIEKESDYRKQSKIAVGGYGDVWLVELVGKEVIERAHGARKGVAKIPIFKKDQKKDKLIPRFHQELSMMYYLSKKYPYFAEIYGFHSPTRTIIMKYYIVGSLSRLMKAENWSKAIFMPILLDLALGIQAMHHEGLVHCDVKPDNILIDIRDDKFHSIITDLGISRVAEQGILRVKEFKTVDIRGASVRYAAPESIMIIRDHLKDYRSVLELKSNDVYSTACIIYQCLHKNIPWSYG